MSLAELLPGTFNFFIVIYLFIFRGGGKFFFLWQPLTPKGLSMPGTVSKETMPCVRKGIFCLSVFRKLKCNLVFLGVSTSV